MILVSEAGSMRAFGSCEAITWPLVASSSSQDLAAMFGGGSVCATAAVINNTLEASAAINFFHGGVNLRESVEGGRCYLRRCCGRRCVVRGAAQKNSANYRASIGACGVRFSVAAPQLRDPALDVRQLAVEEMVGAGDDDDGDVLRPQPVEHVLERDGLVEFAMDQDGVAWYGRH